MWKTISRSAPGWSTPATVFGTDSNANAVGPFGAEEDRAFETELFERVATAASPATQSSVVRRLISTRGAWVILVARIRPHTHHDTSHRFCRPACMRRSIGCE